jgi:hypothetical protein
MSFEWTAGMTNPFVYKGIPTRSEREYTVKAAESFKRGELVRITTSGTIAVAGADTDVGGPHGIALADAADYLTGGVNAGQKFPVALFNKDCVLGIQLMAGKDQNDVTVGVAYTLAVASNYWTLKQDVTTKGNAVVVGKSSNDEPFNPQADASLDRSIVYIKFTQASLDSRTAE